MLRTRAIAIRAGSERDELVREARRLGDVVTNMPWLDDAEFDEAADEMRAARLEVDEIGRLAGSLEGAGEPELRATTARLRQLASAARARRRRLRSMRRRLLAEAAPPEELAA